MESEVESVSIERDPWIEEKSTPIDLSTEKREMMEGYRSDKKWTANTMESE